MSLELQKKVVWSPHPVQNEALKRPEFEVLFGGSRGGGKTDAGIVWMLEYTDNPDFRGLVLRRNSEDLKDWTDRANKLYSILANPAVKLGNPPEFKFKSGAIIRTGHLKDDNAYTKYQGHEYQKLLIEELTQISEEKHYISILSSCRSTNPTLRPQVFLTTNPGNAGHMWVKKRFIDPEPPGTTIWTSFDMPDGKKVWRSRVFIQATMDDNPTLMENDPQYVANIEALKGIDDEKYRAWRFGDWDVFAGQVFQEFRRDTHVIDPITPNKSLAHVLWIDWGYSENSAFACYLTAIVPMGTSDGQKYNQLVTHKEWYGNQKTPKEWARIIKKDCDAMQIVPAYGVTDPAMHSPQQTGDASIASMMEKEWADLNDGDIWVRLKRGSNSGRNSRVNRVGMIHEWMSINPVSKRPYWIITNDCPNFIRTTPMLVHDEHLVEAYDTGQEDHSIDACSYGIEKVKFISVKLGAFRMSGEVTARAIIPRDKEGHEVGLDVEQWSSDLEDERVYNKRNQWQF